jgi:uncharacterized protein (DUF342 family)
VVEVHAALEQTIGDVVGNVVALDGNINVDGDCGICDVQADDTIFIGLGACSLS